MSEIPNQICGECSKEIPDTEWVVNWGSCHDCMNAHLDAYYLGESFVISMGGYSSTFYDMDFTEAVGDPKEILWVEAKENATSGLKRPDSRGQLGERIDPDCSVSIVRVVRS